MKLGKRVEKEEERKLEKKREIEVDSRNSWGW